MKRLPLGVWIAALLLLSLTSCVPPTAIQNQISEAFIQTVVAATLTAERGLAAGAELSYTATPGEGTPGASGGEDAADNQETLEPEETGDPQPTPENPWMLQSWCVDHVGCVSYDLQNKTDSWLQVELKETDTGVTGFFTVQSKSMGQITLIPGQYRVKYTWWCGGEVGSLTEIKALGSWIDVFKCPQGYYQRINK